MALTATPSELDVEIPCERYAPLIARHAVAALDRPSPDLRDAVVLLTSELVTNCVRHADGDRGRIRIRASMPPELARVEVEGEGASFDASEAGALGLRLVRELADRWGTESHGDTTLVWFEIDRR